jgi:hypothetical protein
MHDVRLKRVEKNEILSLVEGVGLNPQEFEWLEDDSNEYIDGESMRFRAYTLRHRPTDYYCKFGGFRVEFSPGPIRRVEADQHHNNWDIKRAVAQLWLEELQKEANAPDLWATIGQEKALSTAASSASLDNRPFSAVEQTLIATKLDEIKEYLLEGQQFDRKQAEFVEREFAYLRQSAARFGRKDWLRVLLGVLIGQAINLALDPAKARGLFSLAGAAFQSLWGMAQGLLQ